jgi:hypothetical protein
LFEAIEEEGLPVAIDLLTLPESDWDIGIAGWGGAQLLAVEALCAAAGQPSAAPHCHYIREWGEENAEELDPDVIQTMLEVVDRVMEMMQSDPRLFELEEDDVPPLMAAGGLMRERIESI